MSVPENSVIPDSPFTWRGHDFTILIASVAGFVVSLIVYLALAGTIQFPQSIIDSFPFVQWVNDAQSWMEDNLKVYTRAISQVVAVPLAWLEEFLWELPWLVVLVALLIPSLAYGGLRLGLLTLVGVMFWGMVDMWYSAMSTLSLMSVSVMFSVVLGVFLGILSSQSDRFEATLRPVLDTMQTMPAFVYLIPAIFFFGIGGPSAAMAIIIYALPPVVRLTNLGIRQVPATTIEAAESYGSTRLQMLAKVKLPLALPSIMLGINQTIMMALGLAVLAVFIGAGGLGEEVWKALRRLKVGWAFEGGICIVFMAIIFDRLSYAVTGNWGEADKAAKMTYQKFHLLPQKWDENPIAVAIETPIGWVWNAIGALGSAITGVIAAAAGKIGAIFGGDRGTDSRAWIDSHPFLTVGVLSIAAILLFDRYISPVGDFPSWLEVSFRDSIDTAIDWLTVNPGFIAVTKFIRTTIYLYLLNPLDVFLTGLPWWYVIALLGIIVWASVSWQFAIVTAVIFFLVGAAGLWETSLYTLAGTTVSVLVCMVVGVPIGILAAYNRPFDTVLRPILDAMQTMPAFVYLIPALFFFGGNKTTAVIATVIYSIPPVIRLTTLGLRQLPKEIDEVSQSFGSTPLQTLYKVKLPMASPSIMLGLNQSVVMALAMQAITPLVAGLGLGKEVFDAMNYADMGKGLAGGIGIVLLTIVLDRLTQGWTQNQRRALGL